MRFVHSCGYLVLFFSSDALNTGCDLRLIADAILDRLVHNAYKIILKGDSMRKRMATPKTGSPTA